MNWMEAHVGECRLLGGTDPAPFRIVNPDGQSPWLLLADHAGQIVPQALNDLGLPQHELDRHIGWDIGIAGTTEALAKLLDAKAILQTYSRLVIDCNRPLQAPSSIPLISDGTRIPGNHGLDASQREARVAEIFAPYHDWITIELDRRQQAAIPTVLIAMHSFTPEMEGHKRPWQAAVLYQRDSRLAHALRDALREEPGLDIGDNQPYWVSDETDYAIPVHAEKRGLAHVELEIRQDQIADATGQQAWADRLRRALGRMPGSVLQSLG